MKFNSEWSAGVCAGAVLGVVGGWVASTWPGLVIATNAKNWWDIGTAVGTLSVAALSAWFTYVQVRSARREKARKAAMAFARVAPELAGLKQAAMIGTYVARQRAEIEDGGRLPSWQNETLSQVLKSFDAPVASAIDDLALEDSDRGIRLANVLAQLPDVRQRTELLLRFGETQPVGGDIQAFVLLERLCLLGRSVEATLELPPSKYFDMDQYAALKVSLHLEPP